ncbi:DUF5789 family protein [Natronobiforma cellulositropha]|uniref:DUF5789 family protein n=1 Tax=Natronobiforma cellulositropha TaxID=1679076 RepID=UPI0021D5CE30|nr:hypothetical protein [Natronobiforma cellulositropha]
MDTVKLSRVETALEELTYPVARTTASDQLAGTTLLLADGERDLGELVGRIESPRFDTAEDLGSELHNVLPREAVGEPYQSEGEG